MQTMMRPRCDALFCFLASVFETLVVFICARNLCCSRAAGPRRIISGVDHSVASTWSSVLFGALIPLLESGKLVCVYNHTVDVFLVLCLLLSPFFSVIFLFFAKEKPTGSLKLQGEK